MSPLLLLACAEYVLEVGDPPGRRGFDTGTVGTDSAPPAVEEVCNGVDDDADGHVDEGFADADADGLADCVDPPCEGVVPAPPGLLEVREDCPGDWLPDAPTEAPWEMEAAWTVRWAWPSEVTAGGAPLVVHLDDDDGDGVLGPGDGPEVLLPSWNGDQIVVFEGGTGVEKRRLGLGTQVYLTPVVADGDGDGVPEIYSVAGSGVPFAADRDGRIRWTAAEAVAGSFHPSLQVADLEGDGAPELVADDLVLDAASGEIRFRLALPPGPLWRAVIAVDLDLDGRAELVGDGRVFDADGTPRWSLEPGLGASSWVAPVQADEDPEAELAWVGAAFVVSDTDGTELVRVARPPSDSPGAPAVADLDGDGWVEVVTASATLDGLTALGLDGVARWSATGLGGSTAPGVTAFDFEGDGAYELLYPSADGLVVLDGRTGVVVARWPEADVVASFELATVADVDEDGHADVLYAGYSYAGSWLTRLRHAGAGWPPAGDRWLGVEFSPPLAPDGATVPTRPDPAWACPGGWRAWPALDVPCGRPDLVVSITDLCVEHCEVGPVSLALQVGNQGSAAAEQVEVDLYALYGTVSLPLGTFPLGGVGAGELAPGIALTLPPDAWGATGYAAEVRSVGLGECDLGNDAAAWAAGCGG